MSAKKFSKNTKTKKFFKSKSSSYANWVKDSSIGKTLSYRSIFKYPLSFYQLSTTLISSEKVTYKKLKKELDEAVSKNKVRFKDGLYYLPNTGVVSWETRAKNAEKLLKNVEPAFKAIEKIPWIKLLAVTGSVAAYNATEQDDIDVFIVTKKNRLWLSRFFVVLLLKAFDMYRTDKAPAGKVCPNIFIDDLNLKWKEKGRNLYVAHEIILMRPIIDRDNTYFKFMRANSWVMEHFGNFSISIPTRFTSSKDTTSGTLNLLEDFLRKFQLWYMKSSQTNEVTTKHMIHFNKNDNTDMVLTTYNKILD
ncbi:MAG: hypothetical protein ACOZAO_01440 [Patescibacteria group bacterium]